MNANLQIIKSIFSTSGLSKRAFAEAIGVSASHVSDILNGKGKASDSLTELVRLKFKKINHSLNEEEEMYRQKYEEAQKEIIHLLKENSELKETIASKKAFPTQKASGE